ncbi:stonustoxin subunit beta [Esox lucius]|uniref:stonustoxin subunit beta n=1 Tax=Esox lucius TaxID=8010 RepID=UPI0005774822|nr:stonustoxin subunit beta [Esox lucius]XP_010903593.1 stonustoxin subunit beta [Esox lucius]XP_010903594.1 stonustoxin subunit beta [Esox lucius]
MSFSGEGDTHSRTESVDQVGDIQLKSGFKKYACDLLLDPNTANRTLSLSEGNRKVTKVKEELSYPDHPDRFDFCRQVLCEEGLTGRCFWEVEWSGEGADVAVTYKGINRSGEGDDCDLGFNDKSWSVHCSDDSYHAWHNDRSTDIPDPSSTHSNRVGVYLDWPAGILSFYSVSSDKLTHIHTFHSTFTEPLYPAFGLWATGSLVSLCEVE